MANFDVSEHEKVIKLLFCGEPDGCMGIDSRSRININLCGRLKEGVEDPERDMYFGANLDPIVAANNKWKI